MTTKRTATDPILTNIFKNIESIAAQIVELRTETQNTFREMVEVKSAMKGLEDKIHILDRQFQDSPIHRQGITNLIDYLVNHFESVKDVVKNHERVQELKEEGQKQLVGRVIIAVFSGIGFVLTILITYLLAKIQGKTP
jgi:chromosome segregation ATPase